MIVADATIPRSAEFVQATASGPQLHRPDVDLGERSVALDRDADLPVDEVADERPLEVADPGDGPTVERHDHVAGPDAGGGGGTAVEELDDLEARPVRPRRSASAAAAGAFRRRSRGRPAGPGRRG